MAISALRGPASPTVRSQVATINIRRRSLYSRLAASKGVSPQDVGITAGCQLLAGLGWARLICGPTARGGGGRPGKRLPVPDYCRWSVPAAVDYRAPFIKGRRLGGLDFRHVSRPVWPLDFSRGDAQGRRMAEDETGEVPKLPPDARLESLDERLDRMQQAEAKRTARRSRTRATGWRSSFRPTGRRSGWRRGDRLGPGLAGRPGGHRTFPLFFLLMLFFGFGVGVRNIMRIANDPDHSGPDEIEVRGKRGGRRQNRPDAPVHGGAAGSAAHRQVRRQLHQQLAVDADRARASSSASWRWA